MTKRAEPITSEARAALRTWYLDQLRPRLVEAAAARVVSPGAVQELDLQVADLFELPLSVCSPSDGPGRYRTEPTPERREIAVRHRSGTTTTEPHKSQMLPRSTTPRRAG
jgi:hypothetical protein